MVDATGFLQRHHIEFTQDPSPDTDYSIIFSAHARPAGYDVPL